MTACFILSNTTLIYNMFGINVLLKHPNVLVSTVKLKIYGKQPVPLAEKQPHIMTQPLPCLTAGTELLGLKAALPNITLVTVTKQLNFACPLKKPFYRRHLTCGQLQMYCSLGCDLVGTVQVWFECIN
ncbi:hypothetical protein ILYODFUR_016106 [Ilyodon furcidens]|uniref:Uncharacterized protein n=1 Tax=Ilyodon furcidens TaxID=33524 RepID=A0ABV0UTY7_9TELE